jgi:phosphatidylserine/phosphatidylglycerophosphate/cardiolipin synthase-like enzyme
MLKRRRSPREFADGGPWRTGNRFHLIAVSEEFFQRMLEAIDGACKHVLLEMYLVESGDLTDRFVAALTAAARRGLKVCVVLDGFGSLGLATADRARLTGAGVELRFYNALSWHKKLHNFLRDHRKLLVIDGQRAFVGGAGLTDEFAGLRGKGPPWRDQMVEIAGPVMIDWQRAFARTWRRCGGSLSLPDPPATEDAGESGAGGRVVLSEAAARSLLANDVVRRIAQARERAWVMSAYFVPSRRFRKVLRRTARRGVDVRLLVPGPRTDHPWVRDAARRFYGKLLRSRVRIFEYQPRVLHGKMTICDDWVSVGSSNLDRWSFKWNLEANQEIVDATFADDAAEVFENDCRQSEELSPRRWPRRAWLHRVRERIAGALDRWLDKWRRPRVP